MFEHALPVLLDSSFASTVKCASPVCHPFRSRRQGERGPSVLQVSGSRIG